MPSHLSGKRTLTLATVSLLLATSPAHAGLLLTGPDQSAGPHVKTHFIAPPPIPLADFFAYTPAFTGGVRVALGDITGDGLADILTATGPGAPGHIKVFNATTPSEAASFFAYPPTFTGGVYVAAGDVTGDGRADIITSTDAGSPGHVKAFNATTLAETASFFPYNTAFTGGVRVAAGDVNGDGRADIITGAGPGAPGHVKVFDGATLSEIRSFFAYPPSFTGGIFVASGDVNGDGLAEIITGAGEGAAGGHVKVFDGLTNSELQSFFAFPDFSGGVRVGAGDLDGDGLADLITATGPGASHVKAFNGTTQSELASFFPYSPSLTSGLYPAGYNAIVPEPSTTALLLSLTLLTRRRTRA